MIKQHITSTTRGGRFRMRMVALPERITPPEPSAVEESKPPAAVVGMQTHSQAYYRHHRCPSCCYHCFSSSCCYSCSTTLPMHPAPVKSPFPIPNHPKTGTHKTENQTKKKRTPDPPQPQPQKPSSRRCLSVKGEKHKPLCLCVSVYLCVFSYSFSNHHTC